MDSDSNLKQVDVGIAASHWRDWLRLCMTPLLGFHAQKVLIDALGGPRQVFEQPIDMLRRFVSEAQAQSLQVIPTEWSAVCERTEVWLQQTPQGVLQQVWTWDHPRYPQMLRDTQDPPWLLYAQGQLQHACWQGVAMVGSRNPTLQGKENARRFADQLQQSGCCIVSGLAMGIDAAAHQGALENARTDRCATVAVVGTGLDLVYPRQHHALAKQVAQHGWVISELPPGTPPLPHHFPRRNRLIAGLSHGVLVVEAALKSGSLITADLALTQGKEVFAVPGSIHSVLSRGCHALLRQGAKLVETAHDVMEELPFVAPELPLADPLANEVAFTDTKLQAVYKVLNHEPQHLDSVLLNSGLSLEEALIALQQLQDINRVVALPGGLYQWLHR
jgi:DNA processing protein